MCSLPVTSSPRLYHSSGGLSSSPIGVSHLNHGSACMMKLGSYSLEEVGSCRFESTGSGGRFCFNTHLSTSFSRSYRYLSFYLSGSTSLHRIALSFSGLESRENIVSVQIYIRQKKNNARVQGVEGGERSGVDTSQMCASSGGVGLCTSHGVGI